MTAAWRAIFVAAVLYAAFQSVVIAWVIPALLPEVV